ncbi:MAG: hypothetical protein C4549_02785 [Deltaproteobacteria bacterium]|jgi:hypothetical protein|nr:MAG: hypothetical protein C4549_02785 [Deltaproteobacteria bacterium]
MSEERLILKGKYLDLKQKRIDLSLQINTQIKSIKNLLAASSVSPIAEIDLEGVAAMATEARDLKMKYMEICHDIAKIEKDLE